MTNPATRDRPAPQQYAGAARDVVQQIHGSETSDGAGVRLRRYIAAAELNMLDPFLLFDVFRSDEPGDYIAGFPPHPHRGFETVTYLLHGNMRHRDSAGHEGVIRSGGVQWMTAGRGIEHSEMPEQEQGLLYGFQLWVNLPAEKKMTSPRYQEFEQGQIPVEKREPGIEVRVIAGVTAMGTTGPVRDVPAAPLYLDIILPVGAWFREPIAAGRNAFLYVIEGQIEVMGSDKTVAIAADTLAVLGEGARLELMAQTPGRILLVAAHPFHEPVVRSGPFVMNTQKEIQQAFTDYQRGSFGQIGNPDRDT